MRPPCRAAGVMIQSAPASSTRTPRARGAPAMSSVSRARSGATSRLGSSASAARTSRRFVSDFEPGSVTVARTGPSTRGAGQFGMGPSVPHGVPDSARQNARMAVTGVEGLTDALAEQARATLEPALFDYFAGGSGIEVSLTEARSAWLRYRLRPRVLTDVSRVDLRTTVLGHPLPSPVALAPIAYEGLLHPA